MKFIISEETKKATTKCKTGYSCLNRGKANICKVEDCLDGKFHFIKRPWENDCTYQISFGFSTCCDCPIRKEIYKKYGI